MNLSSPLPVIRSSIVLAALLAADCSSNKKLELGGACTLNSDCTSPLLCKFGKCHRECVEARDCSPGERCVLEDGLGVCQFTSESTCHQTGMCPGSQVCSPENQCRTPCAESTACLASQRCLSNVCVEIPPVVPSDGGTTAGGTTKAGKPCTIQGELACDGERSRQAVACSPGLLWVQNGICSAGQFCDSSPGASVGTCLPVLPECAARAPDDQVCIAGELRACGTDLVSSQLVDACATPDGSCARCRPAILAAAQQPQDVKVNATHVYWVEGTGSAVRRVALGGGTVESVGAFGANFGIKIALDDAHVYSVNDVGQTGAGGITGAGVGVMRIPLEGGPAAPVSSSAGVPGGGGPPPLIVDGTDIYWFASGHLGASIMKVSKAGGPNLVLASNQGTVFSMVSSATDIYWTTGSGRVAKVSVEGGAVETLASGQVGAGGLALVAENLYWNDGKGGVVTMQVTGGAPRTLGTSNPTTPTGGQDLVVEGSTVYWADSASNRIFSISKDGGVPVSVAGVAGSARLAVDGTHLYWASLDGTIARIAR